MCLTVIKLHDKIKQADLFTTIIIKWYLTKKLSLKRNVFNFDLNAWIVLADFMSSGIEVQSFGAEDEKARSP